MDMKAVKEKAKELGIEMKKMKKAEVIRSIQRKEGNFPCFETAREYCDQLACAWRSACLPVKKLKKSGERSRELYLQKITAEMDEISDKLAKLRKKAEKSLDAGMKEAGEELRKIEKKSEELKKKSKKLAEAGEDAWENARKGVDKAWDELRKSFKKALAQFS